jgi:hypothetical protein
MAAQTRAAKKRAMFSLRLSQASLVWWRGLGQGYTGLMTKSAPLHPEWVQTALDG